MNRDQYMRRREIYRHCFMHNADTGLSDVCHGMDAAGVAGKSSARSVKLNASLRSRTYSYDNRVP